MKTTLVRIKHNGFHGLTETTVRVAGEPGETVALSHYQTSKLHRAPCGISTCQCGESMLLDEHVEGYDEWAACASDHVLLTLPAEGEEIRVRGFYPQQQGW